MLKRFNYKLRSSSQALLWLLIIGGGIFVFWRVTQTSKIPNLLANPGFEVDGLAGWKIISEGPVKIVPQSPPDDPNNIVLRLDVPQGSGVGIGQYIMVSPLQRYKFEANYRPVDKGQQFAKIVLRVSQFNQAGELIKEEEFLSLEQLDSTLTGNARQLGWSSFAHNFIMDEQTTTVEIGMGFLGDQTSLVEIDDLVFQANPTWFGAIRGDLVALSALLLLAAMLIYQLSRTVWPIRRKVFINGSLALASLILTLIIAEIAVWFIPIRLMSMARVWPTGYHIPFMDGENYRLVKNYPPTAYTYQVQGRPVTHLIMSNSIGVRDVELPAPADDKSLILVLGDSMTFGLGIQNINDTWPRYLDEQIDEIMVGPDRYHVINGGVSGYNTFQEISFFKTLIKEMEQQGVKPKIVLLSFFSGIWERNLYGPEGRFGIVNDVLVYNSFRRTILNLPAHLIGQSSFDDLKLIGSSRINRLNEFHRFLLSKSRLYFILSILLTNRFGGEDWMLSSPDFDDPTTINYEALKLFREVAEANNIHPIVAFLPGHYAFEEQLFEVNKEVSEQLSSICQELGLIFLDPFENMQKQGINKDNALERLTLVFDLHYSPEGNLLYAKALAPLLVDYLNEFEAISPLSPGQETRSENE